MSRTDNGKAADAARGARLAACVIAIGVALPANASVLVGADLGELTRESLAIVRGRVVSVDAQRTPDRRSVETLVTLAVESCLKGATGDAVVFRVPGGDLGRYRTIVVGAPSFEVGERVVVFLGARAPSIPHVVGFSQGVFRVVPAGQRGEWRVVPPGAFPTAAATPIARGALTRRPLALDDFEQRVRELAGGGK